MHPAGRSPSQLALGARSLLLGKLLCGLGALGVVACSRPPAAEAPGASQVAAAWAGVYQGPSHLYLRLRVRGSKSVGFWRAIGDRSGRLAGTISGDRFDFNWSEQGGGTAAWSGRGYFQLRPRQGESPPAIYGEWGLGQSRTGGSWWALKRLDEPPLDAVEDNSRDNDDDRNCPSCGIGDFDDFSR
jgi:hypothetical protein